MKRLRAVINSSLWGHMTDILLRPARRGDSDSLKHLLDRSWRAHWAPHLDVGAWARYEAAQPAIGYVGTYLDSFVVAERDGVVVGMYHREDSMLHAIHVDSWAIGTGVGGVLMQAAEAAGARRLEVRAFNARARAFYQRRGWQELDEYADTEMGTPVRTILMELL